MIFDRWEVVVVPFPFVDRSEAKPRPALVLSPVAFTIAHEHTHLAMITSSAGSSWPSDYALREWGSAGLNRPCRLRWKIFTLDNRLIERRLGRLSAADRGECEQLLRRILGFPASS